MSAWSLTISGYLRPWVISVREWLLRPWFGYTAIACTILAVTGIILGFKASYEIISGFERDQSHVAWTALKIKGEFNEFEYNTRLYAADGNVEHLEEARLWLDVLFARASTFTHGSWAAKGDGDAPKTLGKNFQTQLDIFDDLLHRTDAESSDILNKAEPAFVRTKELIADFLAYQQSLRLEAADAQITNARDLLAYQLYLVAAVFCSFGILLVLAWLRSRQAFWLARHDPLTGLGNRPSVVEELKKMSHKDAKLSGLAVHCVDLDRFKMVNDTLGHDVGDDLLVRFGRRLEAMAGPKCLVARTGSDQYVILQPDNEEDEDAMRLARKIVFSATNEFEIGNHQLRMGISMGVAIAADDPSVNFQLLERADLALYEAKRQGGNTAVLFDPALEERASRHRRIDTDLRKAMERGELVNYYQPKIDLATRRVCGAEALLRWKHPEHGMIRPDHFIPIAEDTRLIIPIGMWVADQACRDAKIWSEMTGGHFHIAVNLSPVQFESDSLVGEIRRCLKRHDFNPAQLELEITESTLMEHNRQVEMAMRRLRDLGVHFALDDFGTGYSSLGYLDRFRFDKVKIDRSFVKSLDPAKRESPIIEAVTHIGRGYGFSVCAEGIEDENLAGLLEELGCHEAQGYYFGKPMPADEFTFFLQEQCDLDKLRPDEICQGALADREARLAPSVTNDLCDESVR